MGCSSSTQTHIQGTNKPPAKPVETNGPKKSVLEANDDIETIPDQTKLTTENEPNGIPPEEEQTEAEECDSAETSEPTAQDLPAEEEPEQAEGSTEGEVEEATEASLHEEIESDEPETKEDETENPEDAAEPEMDTADGEE